MTSPHPDPSIRRRIRKRNGCWVWTGSIERGYGRMRVGGKWKRMHRFMYEHHVGPIPDGLVLDHLCRNKACCNPMHLEAVTQKENIRRGDTGAHNRRKTHCKHGHPFTDKNTYITKAGHRQCKACRRVSDRTHRRKLSRQPHNKQYQ